jgi:hypothetical protein
MEHRKGDHHEDDNEQEVRAETACDLMAMTLAGDTLNRLAIGRMPSPSARAACIPVVKRAGILGRPIRRPAATAFVSPSRIACESLARRYAWMMSSKAKVVLPVSMPSSRRERPTP